MDSAAWDSLKEPRPAGGYCGCLAGWVVALIVSVVLILLALLILPMLFP